MPREETDHNVVYLADYRRTEPLATELQLVVESPEPDIEVLDELIPELVAIDDEATLRQWRRFRSRERLARAVAWCVVLALAASIWSLIRVP